MINPSQAWCIQIAVTNACPKACSNCTRLLAHAEEKWFMPLEQFEQAVIAIADFPTQADPESLGRTHLGRCVGLFGGEPRVHPEFDRLCEIMREHLPYEGRGLWTGVPLGKKEAMIRSTFRYLNYNLHKADNPSYHQSALVAIEDVVDDKEEMWRLIDQCWIQQMWSPAITPRGMYFCEVASSLAEVMDGPEGLPIEPGCWRRPLSDFQYQIEWCCPKCSFALYDRDKEEMAVPGLKHRLDSEEIDDISQSNLERLRACGSPRVERMEYQLYQIDLGGETETSKPWRYMR